VTKKPPPVPPEALEQRMLSYAPDSPTPRLEFAEDEVTGVIDLALAHVERAQHETGNALQAATERFRAEAKRTAELARSLSQPPPPPLPAPTEPASD